MWGGGAHGALPSGGLFPRGVQVGHRRPGPLVVGSTEAGFRVVSASHTTSRKKFQGHRSDLRAPPRLIDPLHVIHEPLHHDSPESITSIACARTGIQSSYHSHRSDRCVARLRDQCARCKQSFVCWIHFARQYSSA